MNGLRFRVWHLLVLIAVIGVALAIFARDRSEFDMTNYGNVDLPGGGRGDMFLFRANHLRRPIGIVHYIDGKKAETIATFEVEQEIWVIIILPEGSGEMRVFDRPSETVYSLAPPQGVTGYGGVDSCNGFARPSPSPEEGSLFFARELHYTLPGDEEETKRRYAFYLIYQ